MPLLLQIQVTPDHVLTIQAERKENINEEDKERGFVRRERRFGTFVRRFQLPENIDSEKIQAKLENGELQVVVPKTEHPEAKVVDINVQ